ncbi:hypothetical protein KBI23_05900 [bacterium]|jgi:hypothetical protein|nr:hypothetical protein [bacterium]MBP9810475.1 hypothetical protein [bacterium]
MNLTNPTDVEQLMRSSTSEAEWNANCDKVKAANGDYPSWWYATIVMSGLASSTTAKFRRR